MAFEFGWGYDIALLSQTESTSMGFVACSVLLEKSVVFVLKRDVIARLDD